MISQAKAWREVSLGDICEFKYGKSLPEGKRTGGDVPVYGSNGVVGWHNEALSDGMTIVVGRKGSFGEVNFSPVSCWPIDTTYYIDNSATGVDLKWLAYLLPSLGLTRLNRAAAIPGLNREDAYRQRLLLPPLEEQKRIADILDRAEALRAKRRAALAQLDELTQSIFIKMFGDQVLNLSGWPVMGIEEICELIVDCVNRTAPIVEDVTPFKMIRTSNVKEGKVNLSDVKYVTEDTFNRWNRRTTPQRGDVLLTREAPVGEAGIIDTDDKVFLGQRLMLYRADLNHITPEYLLFSFRSEFLKHQFEKNGSGSTVKHLPLPVCRSFKIIVPPLYIQKEFSHRVSAVEKLKEAHRASLEELNELFASLQYRAFRGEL